jgi:hypothetical protein
MTRILAALTIDCSRNIAPVLLSLTLAEVM